MATLGRLRSFLLGHVWQSVHLEDQLLLFAVFEELLRHSLLRVLLRVVQHGVALFSFADGRADLLVAQIQLVLYVYVLAEVARQVHQLLNVHDKVESLIQQVFWVVDLLVLRQVFSLGCHGNDVNCQFAVVREVGSNQNSFNGVVNQHGQSLKDVLSLTNKKGLLLVDERVLLIRNGTLLLVGLEKISHHHESVTELA
jgi:hypothetical protein